MPALVPLIGITCRTIVDRENRIRFGVLSEYSHAVELAGGAPILIPLRLGPETLRSIFTRLDGLLLSGGADIDPSEYGENVLPGCGQIDPARDKIELDITRWALEERKPTFGICRGIQVLNVAGSGSLYQDIQSQLQTRVEHDHTGPQAYALAHEVEIEPGSRVARALGSGRIEVNSAHHQALKDISPSFKVTARAPDGIVEAVEGLTDHFVVGVQFHPETLVDQDPGMLRLFEEFVKSAGKYHESNGTS